MHKLVSRLRKGCFSLYIDVKVGSSSANGLLWVSQVQWIYNQISFNPQHDLTFSDLTLEEHMFSIFLKHSKSDRSCQGTQIIIAKTNTIFLSFLFHDEIPASLLPAPSVCTPDYHWWLQTLDEILVLLKTGWSLPELQPISRMLFPSLPKNWRSLSQH